MARQPQHRVQKLLRRARHRVKIFYIPGNHDEALRDYLDSSFGNIRVRKDYIHDAQTGNAMPPAR